MSRRCSRCSFSLLLLALLVAGCGGGSGGSAELAGAVDAPSDLGESDVPISPDVPLLPADVAVDVPAAPDVPPPVDVPPEIADAPADVPDDAAADGGTDVAPDVPEDVAPPGPWRSALYPVDWTPDHTDAEGRFLHDFSYAGYHNGELPLGEGLGEVPLFDVVADFGADPSGDTDTTAALQDAIDAAEEAGGVVFFPAGRFRVDDTLSIEASRVVLRGVGPDESQLHFTRYEGMTQRPLVAYRGDAESDLEVLLAADAASRDFVVTVEDAGELAVGDDVMIGWTITADYVEDHGMTGIWQAFNDTWQPFFWREIVDIDRSARPHRVTVDVPLRADALLRDGASIRRARAMLREVGFESLGIANATDWDGAWSVNQVHVVSFWGVKDGWIRDVRSYVSPSAPATGPGSGAHLLSSGLRVRLSKRVTVHDCHLAHAQNRGPSGNGYLFELRRSSEILFSDCTGRAGRHNFIQNWGFGVTGCVWLRVRSADGKAYPSQGSTFATTGFSEFHHSLATANLIDSAVLDDGWKAVNRLGESSGAGHTASENVLWNVRGDGHVTSMQFGWGYVIGTAPTIDVLTVPWWPEAMGTEPEDWTEGLGHGETLAPPSLYEDQLARRLARPR